MNVGDPNRHRPPEPHVQTMRVPTMADIDFAALRFERLERLQAMMRKRDIPIALFYNPANIRYATGVDVMGVWTATTLALLHRRGRGRSHPLRIPRIRCTSPRST